MVPVLDCTCELPKTKTNLTKMYGFNQNLDKLKNDICVRLIISNEIVQFALVRKENEMFIPDIMDICHKSGYPQDVLCRKNSDIRYLIVIEY